MKKNHFRDYATEAFRFYAREGSSEEYKRAIWEDAIQKQNKHDGNRDISAPTEAAIIRAEAALRAKTSEIADLEAVEYAINVITSMDMGRYRMEALRAVYMAEPHRDPERGEISARVERAAVDIHIDPRQIYRWLRDARRIFAEARGLRV
jgi:hypothetical protein